MKALREMIDELSDTEKRQFKAWINDYLGREYARRQRRRQAMLRQRAELEESEEDYETNSESIGGF